MSEASQGEKITVVSWTLGAIAVVAVGARLFSRTLLTRNPWWDDAFIVFSLISALVCSALVSEGIKHGLGMHYQSIPDPGDRIEAFKYTIVAPNFSVISTTTGKISVVLFLLRMMGQAATKVKRYFLFAITLVSVIANVMCIVVLIGFCIPARKIWDSSVPGHCMSLKTQLVIGIFQASYNAFTDLTLAIFPVFVFWNVQMPLKIRLIIMGVMGAGIFAAAATTVKAVLLKQLPQQDDITWAWAPITLWYSAEMYVIIICATLPTLRQFVLFMLGRSYHNSAGRSTNRQDNSGLPDSNSREGGSGSRRLHPAKLSSFKTRMLSSISSSNTHGDSLMVSRGDYDNLPGSQENMVPPPSLLPTAAAASAPLAGSGDTGKDIELTTQVHVVRE